MRARRRILACLIISSAACVFCFSLSLLGLARLRACRRARKARGLHHPNPMPRCRYLDWGLEMRGGPGPGLGWDGLVGGGVASATCRWGNRWAKVFFNLGFLLIAFTGVREVFFSNVLSAISFPSISALHLSAMFPFVRSGGGGCALLFLPLSISRSRGPSKACGIAICFHSFWGDFPAQLAFAFPALCFFSSLSLAVFLLFGSVVTTFLSML